MDSAILPEIILASGSPRRAELLRQIGVRFEIVDVNIDEGGLAGEVPQALAGRLAIAKAEAGLALCGGTLPVLGADTVVSLKGRVYGKPGNDREAAATIRALSGRQHEVHTVICLAYGSARRTLVSLSRVSFRRLKRSEILAYCQGPEPFGKAGAYAVQGLAASFIRRIEGSYSGVMGLPLYETTCLLKEIGLNPLDYASRAHHRVPKSIGSFRD
jgi:septum formation protein